MTIVGYRTLQHKQNLKTLVAQNIQTENHPIHFRFTSYRISHISQSHSTTSHKNTTQQNSKWSRRKITVHDSVPPSISNSITKIYDHISISRK